MIAPWPEIIGLRHEEDCASQVHYAGSAVRDPCDCRKSSQLDPRPRALCPDPQLGTRDGWDWCARCAAIREAGHACYRPRRCSDPDCPSEWNAPHGFSETTCDESAQVPE